MNKNQSKSWFCTPSGVEYKQPLTKGAWRQYLRNYNEWGNRTWTKEDLIQKQSIPATFSKSIFVFMFYGEAGNFFINL